MGLGESYWPPAHGLGVYYWIITILPKKEKKKVTMGYGELELHELEISGPECI